MHPTARLGLLSIAPLLGLAVPAAAQVIAGTTLEAASGAAIAGVAVTLLGPDGTEKATAISDSAGLFRLLAPGSGSYTLRAVHIAYDTIASAPFELERNVQLDLELYMGVRPVELEPVVVVERRTIRGRLREYYERAERVKKSGFGKVLTREDLAELEGRSAQEAVRRQPFVYEIGGYPGPPRIVFRRTGSYCTPTILIDGLPAESADLGLPVSDIEGIEIYRGLAGQPPQYMNSCGVILVWTRADGGRPFTFKRLLAGLGVAAALLLLSSF